MKLRAENIQKSYKGRRVVKGVSIEVNQGEIVGLLGPNGAGKTTSFYMIVGLVRPNPGKIYLDDKDITGAAMFKRAQMGIGYLPQEVSVFRKLSVEDNIMTVLEMTKLSKQERKDKLETLLDEFGLQHVRRNMGQALSGGEKRRTEIARALATDPKFILLDEPFAGVDPIAVEDIQHIVSKLKEKNIGVLITDHNVQETLSITDRTYLLFEGRILKEGTAEDLAADTMVRKVYLGQNFVLRKPGDKVQSDHKAKDYDDVEIVKNVEYVDNMINVSKRVYNSITGSLRMSFTAISETKELIQKVKEFKQYFGPVEMGMRAGQLVNELSLGPAKKYSLKLHGSGIAFVMFFLIPILGWTMLGIMRFRMKECKEDINALIGQLESLKQLLQNPEMEKML